MTSVAVYSFLWTGTPTAMAGISTNGPSNAQFGCTPLHPTQYFTFTWSVFGNGCPAEYLYDLANTCIYTADIYNTQTWGCTWTAQSTATTTVNGGATTAPAGVPATVTADVQWVTVTQTQQTTSTSTSTVDPGAKTVTVTSTQGVQRRREQHPLHVVHLADPPSLGEVREVEKPNSTHGMLDRRLTCPYTNQILCGTGCCNVGESCIGGGLLCCKTFDCVSFDSNAPFVDYLHWSYIPSTLTSTVWSTQTVYSTVNPPGSTTTITPTSTTQINLVQTQIATAVVTATDATITAVVFVQTASGSTITQHNGIVSTTSAASNQGGVLVTSSQGATATPVPVGGSTNNNIGVKVGAGVGVPLGIALIAALLFIFFRRRKSQPPPPSEIQPEIFANNPTSPNPSRPMSELPPYTTNKLAAMGVVRKPVVSSNIMPANQGHDLPERNYGVQGYGVGRYPSQNEGYASYWDRQNQVYSPDAYGQQGYQTNEAETMANRHEMSSPVHEMHELPSHYGA